MRKEEIISLSEVKYFSVNISDLTTLNPIQLLLIKNKIDSFPPVEVRKDQIDGFAVILRSTLKNDYSKDIELRQKRQLYATCQILAEKCNVRSYYSKNGRSFKKLTFPKPTKVIQIRE